MKWTTPAGLKAAQKWQRLRDRVRNLHSPGGARSLNWLTVTWWRAANKRRVVWWYLRHWLRSMWTWARRTRNIPIAGGPAQSESLMVTDPVSLPAFDLRAWNPIRWQRDVGNKVAALGPIEWLPAGIEAHRIVHLGDLFGLRRAHHIEDTQAFHTDVFTRAKDLVRLVATGTVVHLVDDVPQLRTLLGDEMYRLMTTDAKNLDAGARELRSIRMRRIALRDHSLQVRALRGEDGAANSPGLPLVSILLVTGRPELLPQALAAVVRQTYPRLELVLALHGEGFADVEQRIATLPHSAKVVRMSMKEPLGAVLNVATKASSGKLLTKMDDDDLYGADHIWDLVLAREYSQAQLVFKGLEFVYLSIMDKTVHRISGYGEDYRAMTFAGGTLLISRRDLDRIGGWRRRSGGVDLALVEDVLRMRGCLYRTHGAGFMLVRHGQNHVWEHPDDDFLAEADTISPGWNPALADLDSLNLAHPTSNSDP